MGDKMKILFIDDEPFYTLSYRNKLEEGGFAVTYVETVTVAASNLRNMKKGSFDAIILDLQMPRPDDLTDSEFEEAGGLPGIWLLSRHSAKIMEHSVVVVVLTNKKLEEFDAPLSRPDINGIKNQIKVCHKIDVGARVLPSIVKLEVERVRAMHRHG